MQAPCKRQKWPRMGKPHYTRYTPCRSCHQGAETAGPFAPVLYENPKWWFSRPRFSADTQRQDVNGGDADSTIPKELVELLTSAGGGRGEERQPKRRRSWQVLAVSGWQRFLLGRLWGLGLQLQEFCPHVCICPACMQGSGALPCGEAMQPPQGL